MGKKCAKTWQPFADNGGRTRIVSAPASVLFQEPQAEILFAATAWEKPLKPLAARGKAKAELARLLFGYWEENHLPAQNTCGRIEVKMGRRLQVLTSSSGQPLLLITGHIEPSISFSHVGDVTWAALCMDQYSVGIDAARSLEFSNSYPYHRVFHQGEFNSFTERYRTREKAAAALWSAKEAVVKALGCGYRLLEPFDVRVTDIGNSDNEAFFIRFSEKAMKRYPWMIQEWVEVHILHKERHFISVALVDS
jgi:phosphopantetheinyl transferase (holo-ACP synthase)